MYITVILEMADIKSMCRLCMGSNSLINMYEMDGNTTVAVKISSCIDVQMDPEDGLPTVICESCRKKINKFYDYKNKCLKVDEELRTIANWSTIEVLPEKQDIDIQFKSNLDDLFYAGDENFEQTLEFYLSDDLKLIKNDTNLITENKKIDICNEISNESPKSLCEFCGCIFDTKSTFKKHLLTHNWKPKLFQCTYCSKRFTRLESKNIHLRSHLGIRPFICDVCGRSSTKRHDLIRHLRIHSDEKNYACAVCGNRFKRSGDLYCHMRSHTADRPYKCRFCVKDYRSHSGLRKHYKTHNKVS